MSTTRPEDITKARSRIYIFICIGDRVTQFHERQREGDEKRNTLYRDGLKTQLKTT